MNRRELLSFGVRGGLAFGLAKALHNTVLGYGHVGLGENLHSQPLEEIARERFRLPEWYDTQVAGQRVRLRPSGPVVRTSDGRWEPIPEDPTRSALRRFRNDLQDLRTGSFRFAFASPDTLFRTVDAAETRPALVDVIRGHLQQRTDPETVEAFADVSPTRAEPLIRALVGAFREQTRYDFPRYLAGAVDDNVLPVNGNLRGPLRPDADLRTIHEAEDPVGLFCGEYTRLSIRAVHAVPARDQSPPLYGVYVRDRRHKHAYTGFGSVIDEEGELVLPMTFVDYTDTTRYGDLRLESLFGSGFDAYDTWHRADEIRW